MNVYFVDSNIFLRIIVREDKKSFSDCSAFLKDVETGKIRVFTSNIILAEVVWVLNSFYGLDKKRIVKALNGINAIKSLKLVDDFDFDCALNFYSKFGVKYIDSLIASIPGIFSKKWTVVSYDKDFDRLSVLRKEPGEVVRRIEKTK